MNVNFTPQKANKGCMVNKLNAYIVGPRGEIYKCWNDVGNTAKIIGNIKEKELQNKPLLYRYMNDVSPFSDVRCKECMLFPICSGGCSWYRYRNICEKGKFDVCSQFKNEENLKAVLIKSLEKRDSKLREIRI